MVQRADRREKRSPMAWHGQRRHCHQREQGEVMSPPRLQRDGEEAEGFQLPAPGRRGQRHHAADDVRATAVIRIGIVPFRDAG